ASTRAAAWRDADSNKIDDAIDQIQSSGWAWAFENQDPSGRLLIGVENPALPIYAIYVGYDHPPTVVDQTLLRSTGVAMVWPFTYINYIESRATWSQIQSIKNLAGVTRVEAIPVMYATNHYGARTVRARDSRGVAAADSYVLFPSTDDLGIDGNGLVIAILDTGVNDEPDQINAGYPGHESLAGKFLAGGEFFSGQPILNTGLDASMNPQDHGSEASSYHATHVAGSAMGTGGPGGHFRGVAPGARLVDCKVLSDAGASVGGSERGLEWVLQNRDKLWDGLPAGSIWQGIDVVNMSLGSPQSNSDGSGASMALVNQVVDAGIVVCIASGNDSRGTGASGSLTEAGMASPAAADKCIAVGASSTSRTLNRLDDLVTSFSNEGPRLSDGDGDPSDEMKPDIIAPGAGILSAGGDFTSDGSNYSQLSGTSMACPHAAGCVALVLQANPSLSPPEVRTILQNTAEHFIPSVKGPFRTYPASTDPNYDPGSGWGLIDVYAAVKEAQNALAGVQVVQFRPIARPADGHIDVTWVTQREYPFLGFHVYRAPDVGGAPGTLGNTYWYRIEWIDLTSTAHPELPAPAIYGFAPRVATVFYRIVHNAPDNDLFVRVGTDAMYMPGSLGSADFEVQGLSEGLQDSAVVLLPVPANTGTSTIGTIEHYWSIGFTVADNLGGFLPPTVSHPWFLLVTDGGFVNRTGRVSGFSLFVNDSPGSAGGTLYLTNHQPMPQPTIEGGAAPVTLWIPEESPVPVTFAHFEALATDDGIRLVLEMTDDSNPAGARIWRGTSTDFRERAELTTGVLPVQGRRLEYVDDRADPDIDYTYWIEVVDRMGASFMAG
ncbi:MAG: AprE2, partial [bacterium]